MDVTSSMLARMRIRRATLFALLVSGLVSAAGCVRSAPAVPPTFTTTIAAPAEESTPAEATPRLLVVAPHPDDESIAAGGTIAKARQLGWEVNVVIVTCGDAYKQPVVTPAMQMGGPKALGAAEDAQIQEFGAGRAAESRSALAVLGVPAGNVYFLGFPDASISRLMERNLDSKPAVGFNGSSHVPYSFAYREGAPYTGAELASELASIVMATRPTTVIFPDSMDHHPDHWAVSAVTQIALCQAGYTGPRLEYLVHRFGYPVLSGPRPDAGMDPPASLQRLGVTWVKEPLPAEIEDAKARAVSSYSSQMPSSGWLLRSLVRQTELFAIEPTLTLAAAPVSIVEPVADRLGQSHQLVSAGADVVGLQIDRTRDSFALSVRTAQPPDPSVTLVTRVRAIGPGTEIHSWDVAVHAGRVVKARGFGMARPGAGIARQTGSGISVARAAGWLSGARWLLVGADSYVGDQALDHSPWRLVSLDASSGPGPDSTAAQMLP